MSPEQKTEKPVCKYFDKDKAPEKTRCGFARWIKEKPCSLAHIPDNGCGRNNFEKKCPRLNPENPEILDVYGPRSREEFDISFPIIGKNSKGEEKRLPGGIHK